MSRRLAILLVLCAQACAVACRPAAPPRHLVLITVDTLRADHLGVYGDARGLTPNLDALARTSQVFDAAYAPAPFTLPSVATMLTGRWPGETRMLANVGQLALDFPTLASALYVKGFRTAAVVSNFVLRSGGGLDNGFEVYDDEMGLRDPTRKLPWRAAEGTTRAALRALDRVRGEGRRIFLWVHYQDPHGPYLPPPGVREAFLPGERAKPDGGRLLPLGETDYGMGQIPRYQVVDGQREVAFYRAGYDGGVHEMDAHVGALLQGLADRGLLDDAVVAFAADHGEGLGEDDYWFAHGEYLSDAQVRVPFFLRAPGRTAGRRADVVSLVDLAPTLMGVMGVEWPAGPGRDLLARGAEHAASVPLLGTFAASSVERRGIVDGGFKYVVTDWPSGPVEQVFRLTPRGEEPVPEPGAVLVALRAAIHARRDLLPTGRRVAGESLSPEERERLEALGYLVRP